MLEVPVLIVGGGPVGGIANPVTDYVPSARPGGRAPHAWLERGGDRMSTIDLVVEEGGAVLVRPDGYVGWRARTAAGDRAATLRAAVSGVLGRP